MHASLRTAWLVVAVGIAVSAAAQDAAPAVGDSRPGTAPAATTQRRTVGPDDRNCLRNTGSLIPAKKAACLPVTGRSYSGDELRRTGFDNTGRALEALDPRVSVGH